MAYNPDGTERVLTHGSQSFVEMRREKCVYVDKTDMVYELVHSHNKFVFLARPRRFGKTLLLDTLEAYFQGRRELFEGLKISQLEHEWKKFPVIRLNFSGADNVDDFNEQQAIQLAIIERSYGLAERNDLSIGSRVLRLVAECNIQNEGRGVVVLIDEYDFPIQNTWGHPTYEPMKRQMRSIFTLLKAAANNLHFLFITGVAKFSTMSLFSAFNNLINISHKPEFQALCGFTEREVHEVYRPEVAELAAAEEETEESMFLRLKELYDGYHFYIGPRAQTLDIYNPYDFLLAFDSAGIDDNWVWSGDTSLLHTFVPNIETEVDKYEDCKVSKTVLRSSEMPPSMANPDGGNPPANVATDRHAVFLYLTGYLTLTAFDGFFYTLLIPNSEVRRALYTLSLNSLGSLGGINRADTVTLARKGLENGDVPTAMRALATLVNDVPGSNIPKETLAAATLQGEERIKMVLLTQLGTLGVSCEREHHMAGGVIDMVLYTRHYVYVLEFKLAGQGGVAAAERHMLDNGYARAYGGDGRQVISLAIEGDDLGRTITAWKLVGVPGAEVVSLLPPTNP